MSKFIGLIAAGALALVGAASYTDAIGFAQQGRAEISAAGIARGAYTNSLFSGTTVAEALPTTMADLNKSAVETAPNTWTVDGGTRVEFDAATDNLRVIVGGTCAEVTLGEAAPESAPCAGEFAPEGATAEELVSEAETVTETVTEGVTPINDGTITYEGTDGTCVVVTVVNGEIASEATC